MGKALKQARIAYRLCPKCNRAVPAQSGERFCVNDGVKLLEVCPACGVAITSPYARFCRGCGLAYVGHDLGEVLGATSAQSEGKQP
jgi:hypothetical protein